MLDFDQGLNYYIYKTNKGVTPVPEFLEKVIQGIDKGVTKVSIKSKELLEVTRINSQIAVLNDERRAALEELGSIIYAQCSQNALEVNDEIREKCDLITTIILRINDQEAALIKVRQEAKQALGIHACASCGASADEADRFCRNCGASLKV